MLSLGSSDSGVEPKLVEDSRVAQRGVGKTPSVEVVSAVAGFGGDEAYLRFPRVHPPDEEVCDGSLGGPSAGAVGKQQYIDESLSGQAQVDDDDDADRARPWD